MMKKISFLALFVIQFSFWQMSSQSTSASVSNTDKLVPHQEQVFVHSNSRLVFVGEYLYYSIYCLKENTGILSDVSKIAYIKLVDENQEVVLSQKIKLTDGIGHSNFFIPSSIPSGNYKLVAYTHWMLNNGKNYFYNDDITVLNPYTSNQAVFRNYKIELDSGMNKSLNKAEIEPINTMKLILELNQFTYATRQPIDLKLRASTVEGLGNYSISVRKIDELETKAHTSTLNFKKTYPEKSSIDYLILPELRGELFAGELSSKNDSSRIKNKAVALSFPGKDYLFKMTATDANGQFYANVEEDYNSEEVYVQVISDTNDAYEIALRPEENLNLSNLKFHKFKLNKDMESEIERRSIYNQIENAYYGSKPDTILVGKPNKRFYGEGTMNYILDEYTRFSSIKETFVEVVEHVWIQENKEGINEFHVRPIAPFVDSGKLPLVFIDGILLQDHEKLINLSSAQVASINISRNQHFYGTTAFQGVVDVITFKSNFYENYYYENMLSQKLFKPTENKNYYHQSYEGNFKQKYERLPDFRYQLIWLPAVKTTNKEEKFRFYSSDITGEFEVSLEGFTKSGEPISLKKNFWVK